VTCQSSLVRTTSLVLPSRIPLRWPDTRCERGPRRRTLLARVVAPSSPAGRSGRAGCREARSTSLTPTGFSHGQATRVGLVSTGIRHSNTSDVRHSPHASTRWHLALPVGPRASAASGDSLKNVAQGVTDAWVTGTHAEHTQTNSLERRFSAASSSGRRAMPDAGEL
jgi:hypothetical protein